MTARNIAHDADFLAARTLSSGRRVLLRVDGSGEHLEGWARDGELAEPAPRESVRDARDVGGADAGVVGLEEPWRLHHRYVAIPQA